MTRKPEWRREGWKPFGPGRCICPRCGSVVSTNALARVRHAKTCQQKLAELRKRSQERP